MSGKTMRYSEGFKQQVVDEVDSGRFRSSYEASQAYGIRGKGTVQQWVREYGKGHLLRKVVRVERADEPGEIRRLKERVRKLEEALADAHMDKALAEATYEILCERTKTDPAAFKKNTLGTGPPGAGKESRAIRSKRREVVRQGGDEPSELLQAETAEGQAGC